MLLDAENRQVDLLPRLDDGVFANGAGLLAARDHFARHDEDVFVAAAIFDHHKGHLPAVSRQMPLRTDAASDGYAAPSIFVGVSVTRSFSCST